MAEGNVEVVQSAYEAFGRGDIPAVLGVLADDVDWRVPEVLPQGGRWSGRDDVGGFFEKVGSIWDGLSVDVEDTVASGDRVCVLGRSSGTANGADVSYGFAHVWTLRDGKAVAFAEYADPPPELYR